MSLMLQRFGKNTGHKLNVYYTVDLIDLETYILNTILPVSLFWSTNKNSFKQKPQQNNCSIE